eukprot:2420359-Pleurochrysis_carterae.AAC.1
MALAQALAMLGLQWIPADGAAGRQESAREEGRQDAAPRDVRVSWLAGEDEPARVAKSRAARMRLVGALHAAGGR